MSLRCTAWIDQIVLFQDNAFLRTSAHEIVPIAGYLPAPCWIVVVCRDLKKSENPQLKRGSVHGRIWAHLELAWNQFEQTCR